MAILAALWWAACSKPECVNSVDCQRGFRCLEGRCEALPASPPMVRLDGGVFDARPRDATTSSAADGSAPDAASTDGGLDAGADGSVGSDAEPIVGEGLVWAFQTARSDGTNDLRAIGKLSRYTVPVVEQQIPSGGVSCRLEDRRASLAGASGISAGSIRISGFPTAIFPGGVANLAQGAPGEYSSGPLAVIGLFSEPNLLLTYVLVGSSAAGAVPALTEALPAPPSFSVLYPTATTLVDLRAPFQAIWQTHGAVIPPLTAVVELATQDRGLVLHCATGEAVGSLMLPSAAQTDFLSAGPTGPVTLEVRAESERPVMPSLIGGGAILLRLRASAGVRVSTVY